MTKVETVRRDITYDEFLALAKECKVTIDTTKIAVAYLPYRNESTIYAELITTHGAKIIVWLEISNKIAYIDVKNERLSINNY